MTVIVWINPDTVWESAVDVVVRLGCEDVVLLLVTADGDPAGDALTGVLGPSGGEPGEAFAGSEADQAAALFDEAEARLGRPVRRLWERGTPEHKVIAAAHGGDLLVCVRDGAESLPGPHNLGPATRFVVDHAPCEVLLVWPRRQTSH